ncbi:tellurite resistance/C4-dicarboxylate transporter family protein [Actinomycetospora chibensis]
MGVVRRVIIEPWRGRVRGPGLPADAFAVVMATGIVSIAARDTDHAVVSTVLAVTASGALGALALWSAISVATTGRAIAAGPDPLARSLLLFSAVAACDVMAACSRSDDVVSVVLGAVAVVLWLVLVPRTLAALRSRPRGARADGARGGWLLAAVATESLALTAAQLTGAGVLVPVLLGVALACWVLGLAVYLVIAVPVVRRVVAARGGVEVLGPDLWVLMGGLAIATLAGSGVVAATRASGALPGLPEMLGPAPVGLWVLGTMWIPVLVAMEIRRRRRAAWHYERARWATVFPLGMYSAASSGLASVGETTGVLPSVLRDTGHVAFWVALVSWCLVTTGFLRQSWRRPPSLPWRPVGSRPG